jgi:hypothetical protein
VLLRHTLRYLKIEINIFENTPWSLISFFFIWCSFTWLIGSQSTQLSCEKSSTMWDRSINKRNKCFSRIYMIIAISTSNGVPYYTKDRPMSSIMFLWDLEIYHILPYLFNFFLFQSDRWLIHKERKYIKKKKILNSASRALVKKPNMVNWSWNLCN